jgi:LmbE family N-acetylglucosaminyl deacetylase
LIPAHNDSLSKLPDIGLTWICPFCLLNPVDRRPLQEYVAAILTVQTIDDLRGLGTILGVWAHPDDESYLMAGIMAGAVRNGQRVACATATRGEEGSQDHERWPPGRIAEIREAELDESLKILGVTEHHWLNYRDGACHTVLPSEGVGKVASIIDSVRPDTVLTFGLDGHTGHPDHIAVAEWTTGAFELAGRPRAELHYVTVSTQWAERFLAKLQPYEVFAPPTPTVSPEEELDIDFHLPEPLLDLKIKALDAQVSQTQFLRSVFGDKFWRDILSREMFRLA